MPKFKVFAERTETLCAIIEADSAEEADRASVYFYTISKDNVNTSKHLEPEV